MIKKLLFLSLLIGSVSAFTASSGDASEAKPMERGNAEKGSKLVGTGIRVFYILSIIAIALQIRANLYQISYYFIFAISILVSSGNNSTLIFAIPCLLNPNS